MTVAVVLALLVVAAVALGLTLRLRERREAAAVLRLLAVLFAVVGAAVVLPATVRDSGDSAIWGLGIPVLMTLAPLLAARSRLGAAVTAMAAGFLLLWSVLLALGVGLALLPAALAETAAAVAQRRPRHSRKLAAAPGG
jgi:hypothetical protein